MAGSLGLDPRLSAGELVENARLQKDPSRTSEILNRLRAESGCEPGATTRSHRLYVDWNEIEEMAAGGMTFGNHTCSHPMLENLTEDQARAEIREAGSVLARLPGACQTLAYPFGSHNASTVRIARELGYVCLLDVEGTNAPLDLSSIGRIKVSSISPAVLFARMEIVEPVKSCAQALVPAGVTRPGRGILYAVPPLREEISLDGVWQKGGVVPRYHGDQFERRTFERQVDVPAAWTRKNILIGFRQVNYSAKVCVNDKVVGSHVGGWVPFALDITPHVKAGSEFTLRVEVASSTQPPYCRCPGQAALAGRHL